MRKMKNKIRSEILINQFAILTFLVFWFYVPAKCQVPSTQLLSIFFLRKMGFPTTRFNAFTRIKKVDVDGTSQGLSRYDGYSFVNFLQNPNDTNSLSGTLVRVIKEDRKGNLLVGTENGGLNIFDRQKEIFSNPYKNHPLFKFREVSVNAIETDKYGNLWIGTDFNFFKIDTSEI
jgi:ligand-binding sensor domain-containing protein